MSLKTLDYKYKGYQNQKSVSFIIEMLISEIAGDSNRYK